MHSPRSSLGCVAPHLASSCYWLCYIAELPGVAEVYSVTGEWDLIALLRLTDFEQLDDVVTMGLRKMPGVERTQTFLAFRAYPKKLLEQGFGLGSEAIE